MNKILLILTAWLTVSTASADVTHLNLPEPYGGTDVMLWYMESPTAALGTEEHLSSEAQFDVFISDEKNIAVFKTFRQFSSSDVIVPEEVTVLGKKYPVVGIWSDKLFSWGTGANVTSVKLPESLEFLGDEWEMFNAPQITSLTIPGKVTYVYDNIFRPCTSLKELILADGDTTIEFEVDRWYRKPFDLCPLEKVYIGRNTYCKTHIFNENDGSTIKEATISAKVTEMPDELFHYIFTLEKLTLEEGIPYISDKAFMYCNALKSVKIPNSVKKIGSQAFEMMGSSMTTLDLGTGVEEIGWRAFQGCAITKLTLPASLHTMDFYAFRFCNAITSVTIVDSPQKLVIDGSGESQFRGSFYSLEDFTVYQGRNIEATSPPFWENDGLKAVELGPEVTSIDEQYFSHCGSLSNVTLSKNLTTIPASTFKLCSSLKNIDVPDAVTTIGSEAFRQSGLRKISLGSGLQSIDWGTFLNCSDLNAINCRSTVPPTCLSDNVFATSHYTQASLFVPDGCIDAYMAADVWKEFYNIGYETSIANINVSQNAVVYDLQGRRIHKDNPSRGLYILNGKKVLVK